MMPKSSKQNDTQELNDARELDSRAGDSRDPRDIPVSVRILRTLGNGRAARAQLVEASMQDGRVVTCVEKVFAPGLLTRAIYRASFQSPFAYQTNRDAILSCFYRRRVAAAALAASETGVQIAKPIYVRYDEADQAWILAAEWIQGRGIRPAACDTTRLRRKLNHEVPKENTEPSEISQLVASMGQLEKVFAECGLVGSGWQVAPRAMVSSANLLREEDHYTVIDLESGIPAVLVPKYILAGLRCGELPPFDDLDPNKLKQWIDDNERLLLFRLGPDGLAQLREDARRLSDHTERWKESELALLRRPWRFLGRHGWNRYQAECIRRWNQDGTIDSITAEKLPGRRWQARMIWYAGMLPFGTGKIASRLMGNRETRRKAVQWIRSSDYRRKRLTRSITRHTTAWIDAGRLPENRKLSTFGYVANRFLAAVTPSRLHRYLVDGDRRRERRQQMFLLLASPRYQAWFGQSRIEMAIESWCKSQRIDSEEADRLRAQLCGDEVRAYTRGFGAHLALKTFTPIVAPAKYGGLAAFIANGNPLFLLPLVITPAARTIVTLASWWSARGKGIAHGEALLLGMLPTVGSLAFPLQMFAARSDLSSFLVRDAAAKLGQHLPIYGGRDSRTELAMIRSTDELIEILDLVTPRSRHISPTSQSGETPDEIATIKLPRKTRWGQRIDRLAVKHILTAQRRRDPESDRQTGETRRVDAAA